MQRSPLWLTINPCKYYKSPVAFPQNNIKTTSLILLVLKNKAFSVEK